MFKQNEANWDRIIRVVVGIVLLYLGLGGLVAGVAGVVIEIVGAILLITAVIGFCPVYALLKIKTK